MPFREHLRLWKKEFRLPDNIPFGFVLWLILVWIIMCIFPLIGVSQKLDYSNISFKFNHSVDFSTLVFLEKDTSINKDFSELVEEGTYNIILHEDVLISDDKKYNLKNMKIDNITQEIVTFKAELPRGAAFITTENRKGWLEIIQVTIIEDTRETSFYKF